VDRLHSWGDFASDASSTPILFPRHVRFDVRYEDDAGVVRNTQPGAASTRGGDSEGVPDLERERRLASP
jgi:hypothetical protein